MQFPCGTGRESEPVDLGCLGIGVVKDHWPRMDADKVKGEGKSMCLNRLCRRLEQGLEPALSEPQIYADLDDYAD